MSYFPFFREIEGEKCLVIGGGKVAARKISRLKGFGVKIKVVAPSIVSDIEAVVAHGTGTVAHGVFSHRYKQFFV